MGQAGANPNPNPSPNPSPNPNPNPSPNPNSNPNPNQVAGVGPQGRDQSYSAQAVTFFFDVLSAALYPPQDWRELLSGSEELLTLSSGPVPGQRSLAEAVQLIGLPLAYEKRSLEEAEP